MQVAAGMGLDPLQGLCYELPCVFLLFRLKTTSSIHPSSKFWPDFDCIH